MTNSEILDLERLKIFHEELGPPAKLIIAEMLTIFVERTPVELEGIEKMIRDNQWEEVKRVAHRLKGSCAAIWANALFQLISDVERMAIEMNVDQVAKLLEKFKAQLPDFITAMEHHLKLA